MIKALCLVALWVGLGTLAGCSVDPTTSADLEGDRAPLAGPTSNTMNSPTAGPTSAGLSGGTESSEPPELDPNRGTQIH